MATGYDAAQQLAFDFLAAADRALHDEIEAVRDKERRDAVTVRNGKRIDQADVTTTLYCFDLTARTRLVVGERVSCRLDSILQVDGSIVSLTPGKVVVRLASDLGPAIDALTIQRDAAWLELALRNKIWKMRRSLGHALDHEPSDVTRGLGVVFPNRAELRRESVVLPLFERVLEDGPIPLNEDQRRALAHALTHPLTFIWGPPGTGKTCTIGALAACIAQERSVLVVTPSNAAADVVTNEICEWLREHPMYAHGVVQRLGSNVTDQLNEELREFVLPEEICERLRADSEIAIDHARTEASIADEQGAELSDLLLADAHLYDAERRAWPSILANARRVVVTPIANVWLMPELWKAWDAVIIEEASQISLPAAVVAASLTRERVVIVGDPAQLGPVAVGDTPAIRRMLKLDALRAAGVDRADVDSGDLPVVMLTEQHRMARPICELVNEAWYQGRLRTAHRRPPVTIPSIGASSVVLIDTTSLEPTVTRGTRANLVHADVIEWLVRAIRRDGHRELSIGVLAMYREQVAEIRRRIRSSQLTANASTVHRAQGGEVDVGILDLSDAPGGFPTFLRDNCASSDGGRLINVAVTRARECLIVLASAAWLSRAGGNVARQFLNRLREDHLVVDARVMIGAPSGRRRRSAS